VKIDSWNSNIKILTIVECVDNKNKYTAKIEEYLNLISTQEYWCGKRNKYVNLCSGIIRLHRN
jgi:Uma2 family endonuclease